jgi:hypothetical protein
MIRIKIYFGQIFLPSGASRTPPGGDRNRFFREGLVWLTDCPVASPLIGSGTPCPNFPMGGHGAELIRCPANIA